MPIDATRFDFQDEKEEDRYERLVGPAGHWKARRNLQLKLLDQFGLKPEMRLLDLGCGALRVGLPLIDYLNARNYVGIDIDDDCVKAADELIDRFRLRHRNPVVLKSQMFGLDVLPHDQPFDVIWCFQVWIHLTEDLTLTALRAMKTLLKADGVAYASATINDGLETFRSYGSWRGYVLNESPARWYLERAAEAGLAMEEIGGLTADGLVPQTSRGNKGQRLFRLRHATAA